VFHVGLNRNIFRYILGIKSQSEHFSEIFGCVAALRVLYVPLQCRRSWMDCAVSSRWYSTAVLSL